MRTASICGAALLLLANSAAAQYRPVVSGDTTLLIAATGSDTTTCGTSAFPCRTKQGAANVAARLDFIGYSLTISDPNCADAGPLAITLPIMGASAVNIVGSVLEPCPGNTTAPDGFYFQGGGTYRLSGVELGSSVSNGVHAVMGPYVELGQGVVCGNIAQSCRYADAARIVITAPQTIKGTMQVVDHIIGGGNIGADVQPTTCLPGHAVTIRWVGNGGGWASYTGPITFTGCNNVAQSYFSHLNGAIKLGGTVLPGSNPNFSGGNVDDNMAAQAFTSYMGMYWAGSQAALTADASGVLRFTNGDHPIVLQNPYMSKSPSGSCTPSSIC